MSTEQSLRGVTGAHTTDGTLRGFTSLTPFIAVVDAAAALDFYTRTFGAALVDRTDMPGPDGAPVVVHATIDLCDGRLQLG